MVSQINLNLKNFSRKLKGMEMTQSYLQAIKIGKHIFGNARWFIKERYWRSNNEKFEKNPYWFLTLTKLYIGLRPDQAGNCYDFVYVL